MPIPRGLLRIAVIEPSGNLYGSELCLLDILDSLPDSDFASTVYLPRGAPFSERLRDRGIPFEETLLPNAHRRSRSLKLISYVHLAARLAAKRPDLLYVNQAGVLRPMLLIARALNCPVLCQVQTLEDAERLKSLRLRASDVMAYVCNSSFIAASAQTPRDRTSTVYYGYRPKNLYVEAIERPRNPFRAGILGRIGGSKGHDLLIDAVTRLQTRGQADLFEFRFIGEPPDTHTGEQLRARMAAGGVSERFVWRGYRKDIRAELADLDLMLIPSVAEPFGRILCEAAEAGIPVLLSDSGGLGELSLRFDVGARHRARDCGDLAEKLLDVHLNYEHVLREQRHGARRLLAALDVTDYLAVMVGIIRAAASRSPVSVEWLGRS